MKKSPEERIATPDQLVDLRSQSVEQIVYEDNRVSPPFVMLPLSGGSVAEWLAS